jgi:hypothetical protein
MSASEIKRDVYLKLNILTSCATAKKMQNEKNISPIFIDSTDFLPK